MRALKERRKAQGKDRGAALLEFAICLPIFIALLMLIFDAGLGFSDSRSSANAARSGARVGALAGESRDADFRVLDALRAQYGDGEDVLRIRIYRSTIDNTSGEPPATCNTAGSACNEYAGSVLATLNPLDFAGQQQVLDVNGVLIDTCTPGPDSAWCPLNRRLDAGSFLGVQIESRAPATVGLGASGFDLKDKAVFALYFPPLPVVAPPGP